MPSSSAHIIDGVRTPFGRHGGALAGVRADDLLAAAISALLGRVSVEPARIDDVIAGCANQAGEDNRNVARMSALLSGMPVSVPGVTVNRLCGSGMQAVADAARLIQCGEADLVVAGGVEQMTRAPFVLPKSGSGFPRGDQRLYDTTLGWRMVNPKMEAQYGALPLGETAEEVAAARGVSREEQDELALESQRKADAARAAGRFEREVISVEAGIDRKTKEPIHVHADEHPRPDVTAEGLAKLPPVFRREGTVTAGNASGLNDGACALLLASERAIREHGLEPKARYVASASCGVEPSLMGLGPIPASRQVMRRANVSPGDIDIAELNEAFAAQVIPCVRELDLDPQRVNVNGGAIALGHPLGASGARLVTTAMNELGRRAGRYALATMCIGVGQGIATLIEAPR